MKERKNFWDRNAKIYDRFMRKDRAAYAQMYELLRPIVRHKTVLELATGTGLVAKNIVNAADHIEATDASEEMICQAKRDNHSAKLHFSAQDMFHLPYADRSFDVVIVSNALHIVPRPEEALREIGRVLKDDGVLAAPHLYPRGKRPLRENQGICHEAGGFPAAQQVDKRRLSGVSEEKRLDGAQKRGAESVFPADLCGMPKGKGGVIWRKR